MEPITQNKQVQKQEETLQPKVEQELISLKFTREELVDRLESLKEHPDFKTFVSYHEGKKLFEEFQSLKEFLYGQTK